MGREAQLYGEGEIMAEYKVCYKGWYIIEADSIEEALETDFCSRGERRSE